MFEEVHTRHNFSEANLEKLPKGLPRCVCSLFIVQKRLNVTFVWMSSSSIFNSQLSFLTSAGKSILFSSPPTSSSRAKNIFPSLNIFHSILLLYGLKVSSSTERKMYFECTKTHFSSVKMQICGHMSKVWLAYNWAWPVLAFPNISQGTLGRCRLPANGLCVS